eukprot:gnl/TRDRNA2_/TRDRNA2_166282_c6_seq2.p1 gnl/TRDRNA2_/TRDRNA2_166282_c6~~gnl/TRDRNA2_/TRDRNA2_166282_c6_seq2.p1  ORF type:complete len:281 (+),score=41.67 gnl/TRDRNA2_/TRDRNA2_166282_c6_seq2:428-1270(+)
MNVVAALKRNDSEMWSSCSICLDSLDAGTPREQLSITACGHVFCTDCIAAVLAAGQRSCPECRQDVAPNTVDQLSLVSFVPDDDPAPQQQEAYGTKIGRIVKEIQRIHRDDAEGKVILWVQWDSLAKKIMAALASSGVSCLTLTGGLADRQRALADFEDNRNDYVLLLALENDDSGLNLVCANHVLFVHPVCLDEREAALACERQAIGRCLRFGQEREVHVYRFATQDTIEESMVADGWTLRNCSRDRPAAQESGASSSSGQRIKVKSKPNIAPKGTCKR